MQFKDAVDMFLAREAPYAKVVEKSDLNSWLGVLAIAVYDFFSVQIINRMNTFGNTVLASDPKRW